MKYLIYQKAVDWIATLDGMHTIDFNYAIDFGSMVAATNWINRHPRAGIFTVVEVASTYTINTVNALED